MNKTYIYVLTLTSLPNDKHMAITAFMVQAMHDFHIAETIIGRFVPVYIAAYEAENQAFKRIDRKGLTKKVNDADTARINALRIIRDALRIFTIMNNEAKKNAAQQILDTIELYGGSAIYSQPVDSRTGNITNIIEDLEGPLYDAVTLLDIDGAVEYLAEANQAFLNAQSERDRADAEFGKSRMADARVATDKIWRAVVEEVNNTIAYGTAEQVETLQPFARYMNVEIDKYRIQTGQGVGGSTSGSSGSADDSGATGGESGSGAGTVIKKTATFKFLDGRTESFPVEVGTVLIAPPNTVGYKWKPAVPELMPATNKTFKEVPIEDREVTLTFHFLNHEDEEIRGIVGTPLETPANTENCHWEPAVPEVFPEDDMTFNEVLDENNQTGDEHEGMFKIDYVFDGEILATQWYHEGDPIVEPEGLLPSGWIWGNTPGVMPARDIIVTAVEED